MLHRAAPLATPDVLPFPSVIPGRARRLGGSEDCPTYRISLSLSLSFFSPSQVGDSLGQTVIVS